jgi:hypothetical protein
VSLSNAPFVKNLANSLVLTVTLPNLRGDFYTRKRIFGSIYPSHMNPLAGKISWKNDQSIGPFNNIYVLANVFLGGYLVNYNSANSPLN